MSRIDMRELVDWPSEMKAAASFRPNVSEFEVWWVKHGSRLEHLGPIVAEQWIYRHFDQSSYFGLPLDRLKVQSERMATTTLLTDVFVDGWEGEPAEYDWKTFYESAHGNAVPLEPGHLMLVH